MLVSVVSSNWDVIFVHVLMVIIVYCVESTKPTSLDIHVIYISSLLDICTVY